MRYYCIADEDTVRGFHLAGLAGQAVSGSSQASSALQQALTLPGIGIVILTEQVAALLRDQVEAIRRERERPLIVEIPGPAGSVSGHKTLLQSVQEAVGIRIDFQEGSLSAANQSK